MKDTVLRVSKISAARRQLGTAIELWFSHGDPISIHTLTSAAHRVIGDLLRAQGSDDPLYRRIKPEYLSEVIGKINAPYNFTKHADTDPDGELEFNTAINAMKILHSILALRQLGEMMDGTEHAFFVRNGLENPAIVNKDAFEQAVGSPEEMQAWAAMDRPKFYREFRAAYAGAHTAAAFARFMGKTMGNPPNP